MYKQEDCKCKPVTLASILNVVRMNVHRGSGTVMTVASVLLLQVETFSNLSVTDMFYDDLYFIRFNIFYGLM